MCLLCWLSCVDFDTPLSYCGWLYMFVSLNAFSLVTHVGRLFALRFCFGNFETLLTGVEEGKPWFVPGVPSFNAT